MKQKLAIYAGLLAIGIAAAGPATSQVLPYPPAGNMLPYPAANNLPPHEVVALVRSTGLEPLTRPVRHGPVFILHAANKAGHEVRVVVDARLGRIVRVVPLGTVRQAAAVPPPPAPYGRPPAGIPSVPDGYGPSGRATGLPSDIEDAEPYGQVAGIGMPAPPSRTAAPNAGPTTTQSGPPPLPRPRPKVAAAEPIAPVPATTATSPTPAAAATTRSLPTITTTGAAAAVAALPPEPVYEEHE